MIRVLVCAFVILALIPRVGSATESLSLTRTGGDQNGNNNVNSDATGGSPDWDGAGNPFSTTNLSFHVSAQSVGGANVGEADDYLTAYCDTAVSSSSYNPYVQAIVGGPMIVTNSASAEGDGNANSHATFSVASPVNPYTVIILDGTITITPSPGTSTTRFTQTVTVGNSTISCDANGCTGVIKDINAPGGQYTVSTSALGGTWYTSEYYTSGSVALGAGANYKQESNTPCNEYPDFNSYGEVTVTAY